VTPQLSPGGNCFATASHLRAGACSPKLASFGARFYSEGIDMKDINIEARWSSLAYSRLPKFPAYDHYGRDPDGYDLGDEDDDDEGDGAPGIQLVQDSMVVWAAFWGRFDHKIAASVFNVHEQMAAAVLPLIGDFTFNTTPSNYCIQRMVQLISGLRDISRDENCQSTVAEIAALTNLDEAMVIKAVNNHYFMFLGPLRDGSPVIEHDGE
jgi:hypothetical protein